jgi:hypothetical protein
VLTGLAVATTYSLVCKGKNFDTSSTEIKFTTGLILNAPALLREVRHCHCPAVTVLCVNFEYVNSSKSRRT